MELLQTYNNGQWILQKSDAMDAKRIKVSRDYFVRGIAISSKDGQTVYIDKEVPRYLTLKSGKKVDIDHYLCIHETIEKTLMDKLGYVYDHAHEMALHAEHDAIKKDNIPQDEYDHFMLSWMKQTQDRKVGQPPDKYHVNDNAKLKHHGVKENVG